MCTVCYGPMPLQIAQSTNAKYRQDIGISLKVSVRGQFPGDSPVPEWNAKTRFKGTSM